MHNWSVDTKELKKDTKAYAIWRLEQLVNFGLGKEKLKKSELKRYWPALHLDPKKKAFLKLLIWGNRKAS
ncbi:MAG: hypothetical protein AAB932_01640 [Patescibacteria group bacterium]